MDDKEKIWQGSWLTRTLDWLYPVSCEHCKAGINFAGKRFLCSHCFNLFSRHSTLNSCRCCSSRIGPHLTRPLHCPQCSSNSFRFTRAVAVGQYCKSLRSLIHAFKFKNQPNLAKPFAKELTTRLVEEKLTEIVEAVIAVPLHQRRETERGYNQSALVGKLVAKNLSLPFIKNALIRLKDTSPQALLGGEERKQNIKGAFTPVQLNFDFESALLVDDVMTTGSTVSECSATLRKAGVKRIYIGVIAR